MTQGPQTLVPVKFRTSDIIPAGVGAVWQKMAAFTRYHLLADMMATCVCTQHYTKVPCRLGDWSLPGPNGETLSSSHLAGSPPEYT